MADKNFIVPIALEVKGQAEIILKNVGLSLIKPKFYKVNESVVSEENTDFDNDGTIGNMLGMPVFDSITFKNPNNQIQNFVNGGEGQGANSSDLVLITALITASKNKNIVVTKIQGRNGTVKEYVSDDDYTISIKGVLVGKYANVRPVDEIKKLENLCDSPLEVDIVSNFLADLNVLTVVITSHSKTQREGMRNVIDFEIQCLSETPFEIKSNA
jgi:hypothetical protein